MMARNSRDNHQKSLLANEPEVVYGTLTRHNVVLPSDSGTADVSGGHGRGESTWELTTAEAWSAQPTGSAIFPPSLAPG